MNMRFLAFFLIIPASMSAVIFTVPSDFTTIQGAIDAAWPGDFIDVLPGTYKESIDFLGKDIYLFGSAGAEVTIIDADGLGRAVTFQSGETEEAVLTGFTLINGNAYPSGGGILVSNNSSPEITNCIIQDCYGYNSGGAIQIENSAPFISGNIIQDNYAFSGPSGYGGAIFSFQSNALITGNIITGNDAENGSAFYLSEDTSIIRNNLIVENPNTYFDPRGTIYCAPGCETTFINNTIACNSEEAFYGDGQDVTVTNCIMYDNGPTEIEGSFNVFYSDIQGGFPGIGNISDTPCFITGPLSDYHLNPDSSSCIDAGNPAPDYNDPEDPANPGFALWPALGALRNDMGAYGGGGAGCWVKTEGESIAIVNCEVSLVLSPNPCSSLLSIHVILTEDTNASLSIYDLSGRMVHAITDACFQAGDCTVNWIVPADVPPGCYFIRLNTEFDSVSEFCVVL